MAFALLETTKHDIYDFIDPRRSLKGAANGKNVLVTGSGGGTGRSIAESFALAGASEIILTARRMEPLEETKRIIFNSAPSCKVHVFGDIDISNPESVKKLFDNLANVPDVLISNAAVSLQTATVAESDPSKWFTEVDVNLKGTYLMAHAYLNAVHAAKKPGCIINVSSNASWKYIPGRSSYACTKLAINALSEYIHREEEARGSSVRCIAMHPGGIMTELARDVPEEIKRLLVDTPALSGGTAVYLSKESSRFLGGRFVVANWDMEELEKHEERIEREDLLKSRVVGMLS